MTQMKTYSFTSAASLAAVRINVGFAPAKVEVYNVTAAGSSAATGVIHTAFWTDTMAAAAAYVVKNTDSAATLTDAFITSNGITYSSTGVLYGSAISAFTNANPGVITVADASGAGFAVGDVINVTDVAYSGAGTSLNTTYTIASISGNAITTATNTTSYGVWVSGGYATRVSDTSGTAIPIFNRGQLQVIIGTGVQTASSVCHVVIYGSNSVV